MKRPPYYIPADAHSEMMKFTKAELAEMVWDFALTATGHADGVPVSEVLPIVRERAEALAAWRRATELL